MVCAVYSVVQVWCVVCGVYVVCMWCVVYSQVCGAWWCAVGGGCVVCCEMMYGACSVLRGVGVVCGVVCV